MSAQPRASPWECRWTIVLTPSDALKGHVSAAQGNALGFMYAQSHALKGHVSAAQGIALGFMYAQSHALKGHVSAAQGIALGFMYAQSHALKGHVSTAQGIALGFMYAQSHALKGHVSAAQGNALGMSLVNRLDPIRCPERACQHSPGQRPGNLGQVVNALKHWSLHLLQLVVGQSF